MYLSFLGVKHIYRSEHLWRGYLHHQTIIHIIQNITKTSTGRFVHGDLRLKLFQIFVIKQLRVSASSGLKYCTKRLPKLKTSIHKK